MKNKYIDIIKGVNEFQENSKEIETLPELFDEYYKQLPTCVDYLEEDNMTAMLLGMAEDFKKQRQDLYI